MRIPKVSVVRANDQQDHRQQNLRQELVNVQLAVSVGAPGADQEACSVVGICQNEGKLALRLPHYVQNHRRTA